VDYGDKTCELLYDLLARGLSHQDVADLAGRHVNTINGILKGGEASAKTYALVRALHKEYSMSKTDMANYKPVITNGGPVPRIQHVRVFQEPDGWHWCDEQLDYLDARGASYDEPWQAALASIGRYTEHVVLYGSGDTPETLEVVRRERPELTWYSEVDWSERGISTEEEERLMAAAKRAWEREHLS
jgi:transcriptional regulator with XRE-family HTH domain